MTYDQIQAWLSNQNAVPCVIVEAVANIEGVETTIYLSNKGYVTSPVDTPANQYYQPSLAKAITFKEDISLDNRPNISFGDLYIDNTDGSKDDFIDYIWNGRDISIYYGDLSWSRADFFSIFTGKIEDVDSSNNNSFVLKIADKLQQLNYPISADILGGVTPNSEELVPLSFGEVCNVTPLLQSEALHQYKVHLHSIERIIEVRDFGYPLVEEATCDVEDAGYTVDLATGVFTLCNSPAGTITASVQGDKNPTYNVTIGDIIQHIVKNYGPTPYTDDDIDLPNFLNYTIDNPEQVSYYADSKENILTIITKLANSLGSQLICDRSGKLQIFQVDLPPVGTPYEVNENDIVQNSLVLATKPELKAAIEIGYCKNHTIQKNLQTGINEEHKNLFAKEYVTAKSSDQVIADLNNLDTEVDQIKTALIIESEANAEADRLLALFSTQRKIYKFRGIARLMTLQLGQAITINNKMFNLSGGVTGMLISVNVNWSERYVDCEVLV